MIYYTLYNKQLKKNLVIPKIGLWFTRDLAEAQAMLKACHEYVDTLGPSLKDNFVITNAETGEEICK